MKYVDDDFDTCIKQIMSILKESKTMVPLREISRKTGLGYTKLNHVLIRATTRYPIYEDGKKLGLLSDSERMR